MNTDKLKVGLLGLIALTLIVNTYFTATKSDRPSFSAPQQSQIVDNAFSNIPSNPTPQAVNPPVQNDPSLNSLPSATPKPAGPTTNIKFNSDLKDFGNVSPKSENKHKFEFVNTGTEPLIIENAKGSCGCTVPDWPKEPIMPGKKGSIDVVFTPKDRQASGTDQKTVTVTANTNPKNTILTVKAFVEVEG